MTSAEHYERALECIRKSEVRMANSEVWLAEAGAQATLAVYRRLVEQDNRTSENLRARSPQ